MHDVHARNHSHSVRPVRWLYSIVDAIYTSYYGPMGTNVRSFAAGAKPLIMRERAIRVLVVLPPESNRRQRFAYIIVGIIGKWLYAVCIDESAFAMRSGG